MPRENRKRGRREEKKLEKKRKFQETYDAKLAEKRPKFEHEQNPGDLDVMNITGDAGDNYISFGIEATQQDDVHPPDDEYVFHGLLDPQEQEYYTNVNNKIVANDFESDEDRSNIIEAVYRESEGKELKIASSQSCSRYLEKIILMSTSEQLRILFSKFLGQLSYLVRHRFGSHCCETLFLESAKYVGRDSKIDREDGQELSSMEDLFLKATEELQPNIGYLLTERFASHTIRVLFIILSGEPMDDEMIKNILASKKKEKLDVPSSTKVQPAESTRVVPKSFKTSLTSMISAAISSLDATYLRALATHPTGNPVLQLLVYLELVSSKNHKSQESIVLQRLLPDESLEEDTESAKFISGLVYDPAGSHLVEILVSRSSGKTFKKLYKNVLKTRLPSMAKNDVASFVAMKTLERLGRDDLAEAKELLLPEMQALLLRKKATVTCLIERCSIRNVNVDDLQNAIEAEFGTDGELFLSNLLGLQKQEIRSPATGDETEVTGNAPKYRADKAGSLLAQAMLKNQKLSTIVQNSLMSIPTDTLIELCRIPSASRAIQAALSSGASSPQFRRQFVPRFYENAVTLALDQTGSYVMDALWASTESLHFMKEKLASELGRSESRLRESPTGRIVWKNWGMDLFQRRPAEWRALAKGGEIVQELAGNGASEVKPQKKSAIQLARERHMQRKVQSAKPTTGSNAVPTNA